MIGRLLVMTGLAALASTAVGAADIRLQEGPSGLAVAIRLDGKFEPQDYYRLETLVAELEKRKPVPEMILVLNSPGGAHFEALRAGLLVQRKGIGTRVMPGAYCHSACASIFFAGTNRRTGKPDRVAYEGSEIAVHRPYQDLSRPSRLANERDERRVYNAVAAYLGDVHISEKIRAKVLETDPAKLYVLTPADMAESGITFVPSTH
jgi:hypothetical protein